MGGSLTPASQAGSAGSYGFWQRGDASRATAEPETAQLRDQIIALTAELAEAGRVQARQQAGHHEQMSAAAADLADARGAPQSHADRAACRRRGPHRAADPGRGPRRWRRAAPATRRRPPGRPRRRPHGRRASARRPHPPGRTRRAALPRPGCRRRTAAGYCGQPLPGVARRAGRRRLRRAARRRRRATRRHAMMGTGARPRRAGRTTVDPPAVAPTAPRGPWASSSRIAGAGA